MAEQTFPGSNISLVKMHNLQAILLSLLHEKQLSRVQLAQKTSLSNTTITNLITELIDQGIVTEEGTQSSNEPRSVGRPRTALRLVPEARFAVGVHIGIGLFRVAIVDLFAETLCGKIVEFDPETPPYEVIDQIAGSIENVILESQMDRRKILGVGVGASGLVDFQNGVNLLAPNLGWIDVPIQELLEKALALPVVVDNNVRAMALGEAFFGAGRGVDSLIFVYGRTGVGAGFVFGGNVFRGSNTGAGEIGHTIVIPQGGEPCRCGKHGCLETLVSETVILREAREIARRNPAGLLAQQMNQPSELRPIDLVFNAARQGDLETGRMIETRACYLGIALANLVNLLNPELILLGGMFAQGYDLILPVAAETMRETAFGGLGEKVRVQTTSFGWRAGVIGAAALALLRYFYQQTYNPPANSLSF
jgi:glucokinase-like ROK family protein